MLTKELIAEFVARVTGLVPTDDDRLRQFIERLVPQTAGTPDLNNPANKCYTVRDWFFCFRRYAEPSLNQNFLEIHPGTAGEFWGYLRLNPFSYDDTGRRRRIWELAHAHAHPKFRGQGINALYVALTMALAKANHADLVVANPRHVSMLVTLTDWDFKVQGAGGGQQAVKRIIQQGRAMYRNDVSARRLFYAQELRSVLQDGSVMMEKDLKGKRFLGLSLFGIDLTPRRGA
jgi:GNAT superfamily N-acetyltransferase